MDTALWWIRRDLRLSDNQALSAALDMAGTAIPVFIYDRSRLTVSGRPLAFLAEGLRRLDAGLRERNSRLVFRIGSTARELSVLLAETGAQAIWSEEEVHPKARAADATLAKDLLLHLAGGLTIHPPDAVRKPDGRPYTIYGPYRRAWWALPRPSAGVLPPAPARLAVPPAIADRPIFADVGPDLTAPFVPGETEAQRRLRAFVGERDPCIYHYASLRDRLDLEVTSRLSPYLRWGMLSARQVAAGALAASEAAPDAAARDGVSAWLDEMIWREFYISILFHFPGVAHQSYNPRLRGLEWRKDEEALAAWQEGQTGYPVVDAAMRQLRDTGWLPNRARMIAASFLVKDLLIDWRRGEEWFMHRLLDGDLALNNGGWQWIAGTGPGAAPYFRVFNPVAQGRRHDPSGSYVRRWLPELAGAPDRYVHAPWQMPDEVQRAAGCVIGRDYPAPIVDHARARERVLDVYRHAGGEG